MKGFVKSMACLLTVVLAMVVTFSMVAAQPDAGLTPSSGPEERVGAAPAAVAATEVWVEPSSSTVVEGGVVTVEVMKDTDVALGAFDVHVTWNIAKVRLESVQLGGDVELGASELYTATLKPTGSPVPSIVHVIAARTDEAELMPAGEGAMVELTFKAREAGTSPVDVIDEEDAIPGVYEAVVLSDTSHEPLDPAPEVTDGSITVEAGAKVFLPLVLRKN